MNELQANDLDRAVILLPEPVQTILRALPGQVFLGGGFLRAVVAAESPADIDLFTGSQGGAKALAGDLARRTGREMTSSLYAHTVRTEPFPTQFIHRWCFTSPQAMIESFDFTVAGAALWYQDSAWKSLCLPTFYEDALAKRLVYRAPERKEAPGGAMNRVLRFVARGYQIDHESLGAVVARLMTGGESPISYLPLETMQYYTVAREVTKRLHTAGGGY